MFLSDLEHMAIYGVIVLSDKSRKCHEPRASDRPQDYFYSSNYIVITKVTTYPCKTIKLKTNHSTEKIT